MRELLKRLAIVGVSALGALAGVDSAWALSDAELYAAAKEEKVVSWYTGLLQNQIVKPLVAGFEARYPALRVDVVGGTDTELSVKIISEVKAGKLAADVIDGPSMAGEMMQAGLVAPYVAANAANVPAQYKDPNGSWTAPTLFFLTTAVNTNLVKPGEEPKTLEDLLDPKWRGRMAWAKELGTAGPVGFIGAILNTLGEEKGKAYLAKLAQQRIVTIPANPRVVMDKVITGEFAIGLATYNHHAAASKAKGAPVKWLTLEPMVGTMARSMLLKGAPHPDAAKLLINYLLSPAGQQVFRDAGYIPAVSNLEAKDPTLKVDTTRYRVFAPTPQDELKNTKHWVDVYKTQFQ